MNGRLANTPISLERILQAATRRFGDLPHAAAWALSAEARTNRQRIEEVHNKHVGERCVLLANGPSLARTDLAGTKGEITMGMNRIYLNFDRMGFATSYYVAINELVLRQFGHEIANLSMPRFLNWNMRSRFSPSTSHDDFYFLRLKFGLHDAFSANLLRPLDSSGTVTFVALQLAYYMGFKQVILVGLDHRFSSQGEPNKTEQRKHAKDADHFHPNYFPAGSLWQLPDLHRSELGYQLAREAFEADGREILDATIDGACRVFPKVDLDKIL
ncbi:MAG: hypothetical protein KIS80_04445 [Anaerolineales bacterium]|nr:hypothetical protein [Anaerolineales bacterium]